MLFGNYKKRPHDLLLRTIFLVGAVISAIMVFVLFTDYPSRKSNSDTSQQSVHKPETIILDFQHKPSYLIIPVYADLNIGDRLKIIKNDSSSVLITVKEIEIDSKSYSCPRTRVLLDINGEKLSAYCGMQKLNSGGIRPLLTHGINIGIEITRLLFSRVGIWKESKWNSFANFRLQKDLRVAIWEADKPIFQSAKTSFVVDQPIWTRDKFGNWLHGTNYGFHSATDIYASHHGVPEAVLTPVDGVVYKVYHKNGDPDSQMKDKVVNIHGKDIVGPTGERMFFRFFHLSTIAVSKGEEVKAGQVIGYTGHTGFAPRVGDHLHFEIRLNPSSFGLPYDDSIFSSIPVNPYYYLLEWWDQRNMASNLAQSY